MHVRLTYFSIPPEKVTDVKDIYYDEIAPVIREQRGILDVMLLEPVNPEDEYISCTIWKSKESISAFEASGSYQEVFGKIKGITTKPPDQRYYDVPQH